MYDTVFGAKSSYNVCMHSWRRLRFKRQLGMTLLELLVSVAILGVLAVATTNLFVTLIRGGAKVNVGTEVKQNGQHALATMEQLIRNADSVLACSPTPATSIQVVDKTGATITLSCVDLDDADPQTGYIAQDAVRLTSNKTVLTQCEFTCSTAGGTTQAPLVAIDFTLRQLGAANPKYEQAEAKFSTSVVLRKYQ